MTLTRYRGYSDLSSSFSSSSNEGSLYPGDDTNSLIHSTDTQGSLWRQYSMIAQNYTVKVKVHNVCCANDRLRPWLLKFAFLSIIAVGLMVCCLELRFSTYAPQTLTISGGDQVLLPTSTYFNEKLYLKTDHNESDNLYLHVLQNVPKISSDIISYTSGGSFYMASWTYQYYGLYLLKGTKLKISICADLHLEFYIVKSEKKLKTWTQETLFNGYDYHTGIHPQPSCDKKSKFKSHLLTVSDSDVYYLSFASSVGWRFLTHVSVLLTFNRTYYNVTNSIYSCQLSNASCYSKLQYGSKYITLLQSGSLSNSPNPFQKIKMKYIPIPRWSFYLKLFSGIYAAVVILTVFYTIWRTCVNRFEVPSEKQPILSATHLRTYAYSLNSAASGSLHKDKKWVVVTPLTNTSSTERLYEIQERDGVSLISSYDQDDSGHRVSAGSITSQESLFLRSRNESVREDIIYNDYIYNNDQQLLDSCMTSAGVSAI